VNEDDTYWELKIGHLLKRKEELSRASQNFNIERDLGNFRVASDINNELLEIHGKLIKIYQEELEKVDKDIESLK
jgi:hypothetical protein